MPVVQSEGVLVQGFSPWLTSSSASISAQLFDRTVDYATLFRRQRNLRQVISFYARNMADLGLKVYERVDDNDRKALSNSPVQALINQPNPVTTRFKWVYSIVADRLIFDRFYCLKVRNKDTGRLNLIRIPPDMIQPIGDSWLHPDGYELLGSKGPHVFAPDELFTDHGYSPTAGFNGCPPIESLRDVLAEELASARSRQEYWTNGARPGGVVTRPAGTRWSPEAKKVFLDELDAAFGGNYGSKRGGTLLLEDGMEFESTSFSPRDSEFVAARQLTTQEVGSAYHVSPVFLGVLDNANFSNVKELHRHLYQDTLGPDCTDLAELFELQVLPEFPEIQHNTCYVEFNIAAKLAGSFEEQASIIQTLVGRPIWTANEGRALFNKPRLEEGDGLVLPLNVLIGGQASPTDSAPDPDPANVAPKSSKNSLLTDELNKGNGQNLYLKAADDLPHDVKGWYAKHLEVLVGFFGRQKNSVVSKLGAGQSVDQAWDTKRWDKELGDALAGLSLEMVQSVASEVAKQFNGEFDPAIAQAWIINNARIGAENVNLATKSRIDGFDEDVVSKTKDLFEVASTSRAAQIAISRVTTVGNFAREEGGKQAGARYKEWEVRSSKSRHPGLDGEIVALGDKFSNGAIAPGDPKLSEDESAGCTCRLLIRASR